MLLSTTGTIHRSALRLSPLPAELSAELLTSISDALTAGYRTVLVPVNFLGQAPVHCGSSQSTPAKRVRVRTGLYSYISSEHTHTHTHTAGPSPIQTILYTNRGILEACMIHGLANLR